MRDESHGDSGRSKDSLPTLSPADRALLRTKTFAAQELAFSELRPPRRGALTVQVSMDDEDMKNARALLKNIPEGSAQRFLCCLERLSFAEFLKVVEAPMPLASGAGHCVARLGLSGVFELFTAALGAADLEIE